MIKIINKDNLIFLLSSFLVILVALAIRMNLGIACLIISLYLYVRARKIRPRTFNMLHFLLLFLINYIAAYFILNNGISSYCLPVLVVPMLASILFSSIEFSFLVGMITVISIAGLSDAPFQTTLLFLPSVLVSVILCYRARKRSTVIRSSIYLGLIQVITLILIEHFRISPYPRYLVLLAASAASGIIVIGSLPLFEYLFKTLTNISLLELADFNHPILQRLTIEAPGTYHHSLIVGNLSENACGAIGANSLLARIGAYYHDIGKLPKAEYFSENQQLKESRHSNLSAQMSKIVIMNHVKEGIELANKHRLNPLIIDFIQQHHGTSLVYYFYRRALEEIEQDQQVKEEGFRYPGPRPRSREAAVVLLADSVEAATRALKEPNQQKIEEVVHKIINNKFIDGQLDECDLTLKDLEKIANVFIRILGGIYHSRVSYAEDGQIEANHKRPTKEDPGQSTEDKTDTP